MARISINDAAARLNISRRSVYNHIEAGRLKTFKDGSRVFIYEAGLLTLERGEQPVETEEPLGHLSSAADADEAGRAWRAAVEEGKALEFRQRAADIDAIAEAVTQKLRA
ncbi:helix-turn-helix domain-containing protein [Bosea sp. NPDC055353]